jgi:hypothetical protein
MSNQRLHELLKDRKILLDCLAEAIQALADGDEDARRFVELFNARLDETELCIEAIR